MCAKNFGYTPQQVRDLDVVEFAMLMWGIEEEQRQMDKQQKGGNKPPVPKGGSSANGEKISSVNGLLAMANGK